MISKLTLSKQNKKTLTKLLKQEKSTKLYKRLLFLKYRAEGCLNKEISKRLSVCTKTLTNWTDIFQEEGFEGFLRLKYEGRRVSEFEKHKTDIIDYIEKESIKTMNQLLKHLKDVHKVKTDYGNLYKFCKKNSIFLLKELN
jgi:transposase